MNIKQAFLDHKHFEAIDLLQEYINHINNNMQSISGWKSFRQVYYEPVVFTLVENSYLDLILLTRQFFDNKQIENAFGDDDIIYFWSRDLSSLFDAKFSRNIWGFIIGNMTDIHFQVFMDENQKLIWADPELVRYLARYFGEIELNFQDFKQDLVNLLIIDKTLAYFEQDIPIVQKLDLTQDIQNLIQANFNRYTDLWKQKSQWQRLKDMIEVKDKIKKDIYQKYKLEFIYPNNQKWEENNSPKLTKENLSTIVERELEKTFEFIANGYQFDWEKDLFVAETLLRLEYETGIFKATKLIFYIWDYVITLSEIAQELEKENDSQKYSQEFLATAKQGLQVLVDKIYSE